MSYCIIQASTITTNVGVVTENLNFCFYDYTWGFIPKIN